MTVYINSTTNADTTTTYILIGGIVTSIITSSIITAITMTGIFLYCQRSIKTKVKSTTLETVSPVIYDELNITRDSDFPVSDNPAYGSEYI